ncbi:hypothetical protein LTR85_012235 [Meristemomyces frigidus]|nr:hypothetical protein LTR85_012235 [Meristemomyces frigidus]
MSTPDSSASVRMKRVKTGCVTCRIRRVKCDEGKPECDKCSATGRRCDGYSTLPFSRRDLQAASSSSHSISPGNSGLLPRLITDPAFSDVLEKRYFQFFRHKTICGSNNLIDSRFWDRIVLQACHVEPAVKHAVLALSSLHQLSELTNENPSKQRHRAYTEEQHQKALEQARMLVASATPHDIDRVLIACVILICYEGVCGDYVASAVHMRSGRQIVVNNWQRLQQTSRRDDLREIEQALFRLDVPALTFQDSSSPLTWTLDDYICTQPLLVVPEFKTVVEARTSLVDLVRWLLLVAHSIGDPVMASAVSVQRHETEMTKSAAQLDIWRERFESLLIHNETTFAPPCSIAMLRIWHTGATALVEGGCIGSEARWDKVQHLFADIVLLAGAIIREICKVDRASFSVEMGYIDPLWLTASRCRDPHIRREAVRLLRACQRQEGMWESMAAAAVAQRWIDVEEEGLPYVTQAADIPDSFFATKKYGGVGIHRQRLQKVVERQAQAVQNQYDAAYDLHGTPQGW